MLERRQSKSTALNYEELRFIQRITHDVVHRTFVPRKKRTDICNTEHRAHLAHGFASDLRHLMTSPSKANTTEIGKVLHNMKNIDRLLLLKMRPTLINNTHALEIILAKYIPRQDRLLFACSLVHLLFNPKEYVCKRNVIRTTSLMPQNVQQRFRSFATRMMQKKERKHLSKHPITMSTSDLSFATAGIFSIASIAAHFYTENPIYPVGALLAGAAATVHGFYKLGEERQETETYALPHHDDAVETRQKDSLSTEPRL